MSDTAATPEVFGISDEDRLAVESLYRAFSDGNPELLDQAVTSDWHDIPLAPGQQPGREGMKPLIEGFAATFPDAEVTIHEIIGAPGRAAARGLVRLAEPGRCLAHPDGGRIMKAARIHSYDGAPVIEEVQAPDPGPEEVLVRVVAASLNPLDVKLQKGYLEAVFPVEFPYTMGTDLAGTIERIGSEVTGWSAGDDVVARVDPSSGGALAEFAVVPASYLVKAPTSVSLEQAAGIPTTAATAWQALFDTAALEEGQTVLVHAGAGGVGSFAIQFARAAGARVIATASGSGIDIALELGADQVIDYRSGDFTAEVSDVDLVLDTVGGETTALSLEVLRPGGVLVSIPVPPDAALADGRDVTILGVMHVSDATLLEKVVDRVNDGTTILVDRTLSLDSFEKAFAHQESGRARGKILLTM